MPARAKQIDAEKIETKRSFIETNVVIKYNIGILRKLLLFLFVRLAAFYESDCAPRAGKEFKGY